jgi:hypothetical protein
MPAREPGPAYEREPLFLLGQAQVALARAEHEYQAALSDHESNRDPHTPGILTEVADRLRAARSAYADLLQICEARDAVRAAPVPGPVVEDTGGFDLKPDPLTARTPAELMTALRRYRQWAGEPPYRKMAGQAGHAVAASTLCTALGNDELPRLNVVLAIITGCGGCEEDQQRYATAWRQIKRRQPAAAKPVLRVVPPIAGTG